MAKTNQDLNNGNKESLNYNNNENLLKKFET